jgi:hypothetical protein
MSAILTTGSTGTALTSTFNTNSHFRSNLIFLIGGKWHPASVKHRPTSYRNFFTKLYDWKPDNDCGF